MGGFRGVVGFEGGKRMGFDVWYIAILVVSRLCIRLFHACLDESESNESKAQKALNLTENLL